MEGNKWRMLLKKTPNLVLGLLFFSVGISLTVVARLGLDPWSVFHMGLANVLPITFGQATQLTGFIIIALTMLAKTIPGFSTILYTYAVGVFVDIILGANIIPNSEVLIVRILMLFFGIIMIAFASYFYLSTELGAGPRDALMEVLVKLTNKSVRLIRTSIEISVVLTGFLLGGPVGIGTIISALFTGTIVQFAFNIGNYDPKLANHMNIIEMFKLFFLAKKNFV
jgi:uncharacterized membrane protein YczE